MAERMRVCQTCGAGVVFAPASDVLLEPAGFGATISNKDGTVFWQDIYRQHVCPTAAVEARRAWLESITTEEERQRASDLAQQREAARELSKTFACPKAKCEAPVGEGCVNITILNKTGERTPTAWPHPERMNMALKALQAMGNGAEEEEDAQGPIS